MVVLSGSGSKLRWVLGANDAGLGHLGLIMPYFRQVITKGGINSYLTYSGLTQEAKGHTIVLYAQANYYRIIL